MTGSSRLKRSASPVFWDFARKGKRFAPNPTPGPHPKVRSIPLTVLIRDFLRLAKTAKEARTAIIDGGVIVDGIVRRDPNFPVGLMDLIEFPLMGKVFRIVPTKARTLYPVESPENEKSLKLCAVKDKVTTKGGSIQYALHDGRSIVTSPEVSMKVNDSALIAIPSQKIVKHVAMKKGSLVMITGGQRQAAVGELKAIKPGTISRPRMVSVKIGDITVEIPAKLVLVIGEEKPLVSLGVR